MHSDALHYSFLNIKMSLHFAQSSCVDFGLKNIKTCFARVKQIRSFCCMHAFWSTFLAWPEALVTPCQETGMRTFSIKQTFCTVHTHSLTHPHASQSGLYGYVYYCHNRRATHAIILPSLGYPGATILASLRYPGALNWPQGSPK